MDSACKIDKPERLSPSSNPLTTGNLCHPSHTTCLQAPYDSPVAWNQSQPAIGCHGVASRCRPVGTAHAACPCSPCEASGADSARVVEVVATNELAPLLAVGPPSRGATIDANRLAATLNTRTTRMVALCTCNVRCAAANGGRRCPCLILACLHSVRSCSWRSQRCHAALPGTCLVRQSSAVVSTACGRGSTTPYSALVCARDCQCETTTGNASPLCTSSVGQQPLQRDGPAACSHHTSQHAATGLGKLAWPLNSAAAGLAAAQYGRRIALRTLCGCRSTGSRRRAKQCPCVCAGASAAPPQADETLYQHDDLAPSAVSASNRGSAGRARSVRLRARCTCNRQRCAEVARVRTTSRAEDLYQRDARDCPRGCVVAHAHAAPMDQALRSPI